MKLFRFAAPSGPRLGLEDADGRGLDLTAADPESFASLGSWLALPDPLGAVEAAASRATSPLSLESLELLAPVDHQEVWAAGVTYERSRQARREESPAGGDFYDLVYAAERPELFFKALPHRVSGPGAPIRVRADSAWNVPEPELALVLSAAGRVVGFTIGNDVSSRSIEGENPLYLPQAKVYEGACALGPVVALAGAPGLDPRGLAVAMTIRRQGREAFAGQTSTARLRRSPEELAAWLFRELSFPWGAVLLTGTGIVPPEPFTLQPGDVVEIEIEGIGRLVNEVSPSPGPSPPGSGRPRASPPAP
jgi:2-dehydro-3-deoxy-D-arabinonate dehydratase